MGMITVADLMPDIDEDLARRILAAGRSIAPCVDSLDTDDTETVLAIYRAVAKEANGRGSHMIANQRIGTAAVTYKDDADWFSPNDKAALRAMCGGASTAGPIGSFPTARPLRNIWPEEC